MMNMRKQWLLGALIMVATIIAGGIVWNNKTACKSTAPIYEFQMDRDAQDIKDLMELDWYWLISSSDYQVDFMLKHKAPTHKNPRYFGKMAIKVMRLNNQFVGFVTYYKKSAYEGTVLFLAVRPEFRGKRHAHELLDYALCELKKMGALYVTLVTRVNNTKAQSVYIRYGFQEEGRDDTFVYYKKDL